ncbi:hypothetical protein V5O48_011858, partial [Marasmius crinis-equi]
MSTSPPTMLAPKNTQIAPSKALPNRTPTIHPDKVAYLARLLPAYLQLPDNSKDKTAFWVAFRSEFLAHFPLNKYPAPKPNLRPLGTVSPEEWNTMTRRAKDAWKKAEMRRQATPEQLVVE